MASNPLTHPMLVSLQEKGNTAGTIAYLKFLQQTFPDQHLLIFWDGASYHTSKELRAYLSEVN